MLEEKRVYGVETSDLPCLDSGRNSNITFNDMYDLWQQGSAVDEENELDPQNITYEVPQLEEVYIWTSEGITFPRQSIFLNAEVMKTTKLELFKNVITC